MLRSLRQTLGYRVHATDGELGKVADFYLDDGTWRLRYLVVETGSWLSERKVLVPPFSAGEPDWHKGLLPVALTREQVRRCPPVDADLPVSRQKELDLARHYQFAPYWEGSPGFVMVPMQAPLPEAAGEGPTGDPHLRSVKEVCGYRIHAEDGDIGHVADFLVQTDVWAIRYLVVDFSRWLPNRKVLISPAWVSSVVWNAKQVHVSLSAERIKGSHPFDPSTPVNREYEGRLYDYYGRPKYWISEEAGAKDSPKAGGGKGPGSATNPAGAESRPEDDRIGNPS